MKEMVNQVDNLKKKKKKKKDKRKEDGEKVKRVIKLEFGAPMCSLKFKFRHETGKNGLMQLNDSEKPFNLLQFSSCFA